MSQLLDRLTLNVGTKIGRIRVIFKLPETLPDLHLSAAPPQWPKGALAYVEWFSPLGNAAHPRHKMYVVRKQESRQGAVVPLASIRQSCMLFPKFGAKADITWKTHNVLDKCRTFYVNNWSSLYAYQTLW